MIRVSSPGRYPASAGPWDDDPHPGPSSPPYSPVPTSSERVLAASPSSPESGSTHDVNDDPPLWSPTASFLYESPLASISLRRRVWDLRQPVYGFNDIVQGAIKLSNRCIHVVRMEVSLLGRVKVTASERGWISDLVNLNLVTSTVVLSCPPRGGFTPTEESFPFSIPFPSYVNGGTSSLPPSYASWSPGFLSEVEYCVRVDIHRKGLRRHELRIVPIIYLPKTWPSHPIPSRISTFGLHPDSILYETASLPPVWPKDVCPKANATIPTVELFYPSSATYSSGHSIHLKLTIKSTEAPPLAQLLISGLEAQLVKHMVALSPTGQVVGTQEDILSKGNFAETDTTQEGIAITYFDLTLGESGKEQSWRIPAVIEVAYLIRVSVRCPESALNFVPAYKHVSRIGVATEPWGTRTHELLEFRGFSDPAIGMVDTRIELRPPSSVAW